MAVEDVLRRPTCTSHSGREMLLQPLWPLPSGHPCGRDGLLSLVKCNTAAQSVRCSMRSILKPARIAAVALSHRLGGRARETGENRNSH